MSGIITGDISMKCPEENLPQSHGIYNVTLTLTKSVGYIRNKSRKYVGMFYFFVEFASEHVYSTLIFCIPNSTSSSFNDDQSIYL
jgi:hypothetical protein